MTPKDFIARWQHASGSELANAQSFIRELAELLGEPPPNPAREDTRDNDYVFERRVIFRHGDGSTAEGRVDCYKRGHFVLEAKKLKQNVQTKGFDDAMLRARAQAEGYARALPANEGRPPFIVTVDVGNLIEIYAEFSRSGATYTPFPDPRSHRIALADLADEAIRARRKALWTDPLSLDPSRVAARATRQIAEKLAGVAKSLEGAGHHPERVAGFLTRCLFSMFAEDVGLLPSQAFTDLLATLSQRPEQFVPLVGALWQEMDVGGFSVVLRQTLPRFNGKLFKSPDVLPLSRDQIDLLRDAAHADWTQVEPAIFGTLLERALDPVERQSLGAHYTPRPYVERLVLPTVIEPLRDQWANVQAAALLLANEGKTDAALKEIDAFHHALCQVRVLDPACGSANFLYVTLEHMKRLEGELLDFAQSVGQSVGGVQQRLEGEGLTVDPHQFLGLEVNPRAAAIAELVLWIGYLQWHFRTRRGGLPPSPILRDFRNIECRDAVLDFDERQLLTAENGQPVTRWDGVTLKVHPVTGERVPDELAQVPVWRYVNPRPAVWPEADFIVGNPPFIGAASMRAALGDGYVEALRSTWPAVPESADYVMFWWHYSDVVGAGALRANADLGSRGYQLIGSGFIVTPEQVSQLEADAPIKDYRNGRDLTERPRGVKVIDLFGLSAEDVRRAYPATYQWVLERIKPERDQNARAGYRDNWWIFGEARRDMRRQLAGLLRYIATVETAKHRLFQFLDAAIAPDNMLVCLALAEAYTLGVLSSSVHVVWALAAGGRLGVGNDPRYNKSRCFETFPFPVATADQQARIADLAEQLDAHRKARQAADPALTLTGMYNVLHKLRTGEPLTAKDKAVRQSALVSVLQTLLPEQMALLARLLDETPQTEAQLAARINGKGAWKKRLPDLLQTLVALGRARQVGAAWVVV